MSAENEIRNIKLFEEEIRNIKQMAFDAAHPVNETYTQYPQQDDPMTLYNKDGVTSVWEIQSQYSGAFFRSSNAPEAVYKADDEDEYYIQDTVTGALLPINASASGGPSISPTPSGAPIIIEGKTYQRYPVTASSRNAADYINKTNSLSVQASQNKEHNHNGRTYTVGETYGSANTGESGAASFWIRKGAYGDSIVAGWSNTSVGANQGYSSRDFGAGGDTRVGDIVYINNHTHNYDHYHVIFSDGGAESRPNNYTYKIWKRIS